MFTLIAGNATNKIDKVKLLVAKGANVNHVNASGRTPIDLAVSLFAQYDVALLLLEKGANYKRYAPMSNSRLIHHVVEQELRLPQLSPQKQADYKRLTQWLKDHGESVDQARKDQARWKSWSITTGEFQRKMAEEIAEREAREEREKKAADDVKHDNK